jgi:hypothetical protein
MLFHVYNSNIALLKNLQNGSSLSEGKRRRLRKLTFHFHDLLWFEEAKQKLIDAKVILRPYACLLIV